MPIAMTDGRTYENQLDMLFAKDMPSREETNKQQRQRFEEAMPPDMRGPPPPEAPTENNQLSDQPAKDQNDPYYWGYGQAKDRQGPAMVPLPEPKFHEIMDHMDYLIDPEGALPTHARPTSAETPPKSAYQNFTDKLEELSKSLNPSFIPTAEQFRDAPWKEKLGFIIASSFMFAGPGKGPKGTLPSGKSDPLAHWTEGLAEFDKANPPILKTLEAAEKAGSQTAANLLGEYRKIDDPVVRAEFSKMVKDKIASASEGGETAPSDITNPRIDKEDLQRMLGEGKTFQQIADEAGVTRSAIAGQVNRLGLQRGESPNPAGRGVADVNYEHTWSTREMAAVRRYKNEGGELPEELQRRGVDQVNQKIDELNNRVDRRLGSSNNRSVAGDKSYEEGIIDSQSTLKRAEEAKARREGGIHYDKIPEVKELLKDGESLASIARKLDIPAPSVRQLVRTNNELSSLRTTGHSSSNWTPGQDKLLTHWYNDPNSDLFGTPPGLEKRSPASIDRRIKALGLDKQDGAEPFVPRGAVSAPEKGSGSGGGNEYGPHNPNRFADMTPDEASAARAAFEKDLIGQYGLTGKRGAKTKMFELMTEAEHQQHRDYTARIYDYPGSDVSGTPKEVVRSYNVTETRGKTGFNTFSPSRERKGANENRSLQIDDPVMEAAIDKTWENFGRANRDNLPLISPTIESALQEMNPAGFKKLKQFELEMDYKYKQPSGRRHWLSDLTEAEANKYRKLYNDIDKIRPVK